MITKMTLYSSNNIFKNLSCECNFEHDEFTLNKIVKIIIILII